jgi:hypothetical protein
MLMRELGIFVDQARRHREVPSDLVGVLLAESLQLVARAGVEIARSDLLGDLGIVVPGADRSDLALTDGPIGSICASARGPGRPSAISAVAVARGVGTVAVTLGVGAVTLPLGVRAVALTLRVGTVTVTLDVGTVTLTLRIGTVTLTLRIGTVTLTLRIGTVTVTLRIGTVTLTLRIGTVTLTLRIGTVTLTLRIGTVTLTLRIGTVTLTLRIGTVTLTLRIRTVTLAPRRGTAALSVAIRLAFATGLGRAASVPSGVRRASGVAARAAGSLIAAPSLRALGTLVARVVLCHLSILPDWVPLRAVNAKWPPLGVAIS